MPNQVVLMPVEVEGVILLVEATGVGGSENTSRIGKAQGAVTDAFEQARDAIVLIATSTIDTIRELGRSVPSPNEVEVKFGLKFSAQGGIIVAGTAGEANLEVTLKFNAMDQPDKMNGSNAG